jgi:hypothetical protein
VRASVVAGRPPIQAQAILPAREVLLLGNVEELPAIDGVAANASDRREEILDPEGLDGRIGIVSTAKAERRADAPERA